MKTASGRKTALSAQLLGATAMLCVLSFGVLPPIPAAAQVVNTDISVSEDAPMLLEANTLVYDRDTETISAIGEVQIDYDNNRLVARRVDYNQRTGRIIARGNVELVQADGTKVFAEEVDITDNFSDGFINSLRVETIDQTYFEAESSERSSGSRTIFNNGVYTACKACEDKPEKAPAWRIKARKIVRDTEQKKLRFESATFELFGLPIAYLPVLQLPDRERRKSGFLPPNLKYKSDLGFGVKVPYYFALSPTYDLTVSGTYFTKQGFLGEAEWRQRLDNGRYNIRVAGISQAKPGEFLATEIDSTVRQRGLIASKGDFRINPRWSFGWDVLAQSDKNFAYTYDIDGYNSYSRRSEIYLTGLNDRNYFDLRAFKFEVQESIPDSSVAAMNPRQPWVLPSFDYSYTPDTPIAGGELNIDVNAQALHRDTADLGPAIPVRGVAGTTGRLTTEAEWKRTLVMQGGILVTPILHGRVDSHFLDTTAIASATAITKSHAYRTMATAGLEVRWPVLFSTSSATHILEPTAQLFVRPDENNPGTLPNEDAQSLVFDATSLFDRDKFSGYDRTEGGTRANLGVRYSGEFGNGWTTTGLFGQSYHLGGTNPFTSPDLVNAGAFSGLETSVSDYVGLVGVRTPSNLFGTRTPVSMSFSVSGRFDEKTFGMRRMGIKAGVSAGYTSVTGTYTFIDAQPLYGFGRDRQEVSVYANTRLHENWSLFGSSTYDMVSDTLVASAVGLTYSDDCFIYTMNYSQSRSIATTTTPSDTTHNFGIKISFRTLGEVGFSSGQAAGFTSSN